MSTEPITTRNSDWTAVLAGLTLTLLLPIGMWLGVHSAAFSAIFGFHLGLLLFATFLGTRSFWSNSSTPFRVLFVLLLIVIALIDSIPITNRDALIHHLAVPKWWAELGYIHEIPWHEWSYYPMLLDLGFTGFVAFDQAWLTPFYHALYLLLLAAGVWNFLPRETRNIGFLVTLSVPICLKLATTPVVDLGLALYSLLALSSLVTWAKTQSRQSLLAVGCALGLALSTKYNGLLFAAFFFPFALIFLQRMEVSWRNTLKALVCIGVLAAIIFSPWCIKNINWTGNPVFPLMRGTFGPVSTEFALGSLSPLEQQLMLYKRSAAELLATPLMMLFLGKDESPAWFDGVLTPFFLLAAIAAWKRRKEPWVVLLAAVIISYWAFAFVYAMPRVRYLSPLFGPLVILSCTSFEVSKRNFSGLLVVHALFCLVYLGRLTGATHLVEWLDPKTTRESYLTAHIPEYKFIQLINAQLPKNALVYLLYTGNRFFYIDRSVYSDGHYSGGELAGWIKASKTPEDLKPHFEKLYVTHILMNHVLTNKGLEPNLSESERVLWDTFASKYLELLRQEGPFSLWRIK